MSLTTASGLFKPSFSAFPQKADWAAWEGIEIGFEECYGPIVFQDEDAIALAESHLPARAGRNGHLAFRRDLRKVERFFHNSIASATLNCYSSLLNR